MNSQVPGVGGFFPGMKPLWHPPIHMSWILSIVLLVIAANAEEIPHKIRQILLNPFVFFGILVACLFMFEYGYVNLCFSVMFLLLVIWATKQRKEGFVPSGTLDWVTNDKRWFSEVVLKEKPIAIQDKDVATYPVQGT